MPEMTSTEWDSAIRNGEIAEHTTGLRPYDLTLRAAIIRTRIDY